MATRAPVILGSKLPPARPEHEVRELFNKMRAGDEQAFVDFYMNRLRFATSILAEFNFSENRHLIRSDDAEEFLRKKLYDVCVKLRNGAIDHHEGEPNYDGYIAKHVRWDLKRYFVRNKMRSMIYLQVTPTETRIPCRVSVVDAKELVGKAFQLAYTKTEKGYLELALQGLNQSEIAAELGVTRDAISKVKRSIRTRLQENGYDF